MVESQRRVDLRYGDFACSIQGFDDPVPPLRQILRTIQRVVEETPEFSRAEIRFDTETIETLLSQIARRGGLEADALTAVPGLILVHGAAGPARVIETLVDAGPDSVAAPAAPALPDPAPAPAPDMAAAGDAPPRATRPTWPDLDAAQALLAAASLGWPASDWPLGKPAAVAPPAEAPRAPDPVDAPATVDAALDPTALDAATTMPPTPGPVADDAQVGGDDFFPWDSVAEPASAPTDPDAAATRADPQTVSTDMPEPTPMDDPDPIAATESAWGASEPPLGDVEDAGAEATPEPLGDAGGAAVTPDTLDRTWPSEATDAGWSIPAAESHDTVPVAEPHDMVPAAEPHDVAPAAEPHDLAPAAEAPWSGTADQPDALDPDLSPDAVDGAQAAALGDEDLAWDMPADSLADAPPATDAEAQWLAPAPGPWEAEPTLDDAPAPATDPAPADAPAWAALDPDPSGVAADAAAPAPDQAVAAQDAAGPGDLAPPPFDDAPPHPVTDTGAPGDVGADALAVAIDPAFAPRPAEQAAPEADPVPFNIFAAAPADTTARATLNMFADPDEVWASEPQDPDGGGLSVPAASAMGVAQAPAADPMAAARADADAPQWAQAFAAPHTLSDGAPSDPDLAAPAAQDGAQADAPVAEPWTDDAQGAATDPAGWHPGWAPDGAAEDRAAMTGPGADGAPAPDGWDTDTAAAPMPAPQADDDGAPLSAEQRPAAFAARGPRRDPDDAFAGPTPIPPGAGQFGALIARLNAQTDSAPLVPPAADDPASSDGTADSDGIWSAPALARAAGAQAVPELLAAAAAWLTLIDNRPRFTRRDVMAVFETLPGAHPRTLEARIKGYGKLVRDKQVVLVDDGLFALAQSERDRFAALID